VNNQQQGPGLARVYLAVSFLSFCHLTTLSAVKLHSAVDRMISEYGMEQLVK
jgi:hypothetical protein